MEDVLTITSEDDMWVDRLLREIRRYLAAVDAFRAAGCEPAWEPEREVAA